MEAQPDTPAGKLGPISHGHDWKIQGPNGDTGKLRLTKVILTINLRQDMVGRSQ